MVSQTLVPNGQPVLTSQESFRQRWIDLLSQLTIHMEIAALPEAVDHVMSLTK